MYWIIHKLNIQYHMYSIGLGLGSTLEHLLGTRTLAGMMVRNLQTRVKLTSDYA